MKILNIFSSFRPPPKLFYSNGMSTKVTWVFFCFLLLFCSEFELAFRVFSPLITCCLGNIILYSHTKCQILSANDCFVFVDDVYEWSVGEEWRKKRRRKKSVLGRNNQVNTIQTNCRNDWVICRCIQIVILPQNTCSSLFPRVWDLFCLFALTAKQWDALTHTHCWRVE